MVFEISVNEFVINVCEVIIVVIVVKVMLIMI